MKNFKKTLCLILALIMILSSAVVSASAAEKNERLPQVYVMGFESLWIYPADAPTRQNYFPVNFDFLMSNLKNRLEEYKDLDNLSPDILYNFLYSAFYDTFGFYALKGDGITNASENVIVDSFDFAYENGVYYFYYDSRLSPVDLAKQLNDYIIRVQKHSGSDRFELVGASYGGTVVATYLNEYPEMHQYIDSCLLSVPSYGGFSVLGEVYSGDFFIDHNTLTQYIDVNMDNDYLSLLLSVLNKSGALQIILESLLIPGVKAIAMDAARDLIHDTLGTIPSFWSFVSEEYFYDAMKNIFGENYTDPNHEYAGLISKATYYQENIMQRLDEIYFSAENNGIKMNIICKYGKPPMPISEKGSFQSDGSVDVKDVTLGATASKFGETLPKDYVQARYNEYNFISPDNIIDASTGIDPLHTWYVKGLDHRHKTTGFDKLINYIVYEDPDVFSSNEYPQYTLAAADGTLVPITEPDIKEETSLVSDLIRLLMKICTLLITKLTSLIGTL